MRHTPWMHSNSLYHRHRFPAEIISHCVWLYFRFALSFRDVEEMLAMRGVYVSRMSFSAVASSGKRSLVLIAFAAAISPTCEVGRGCGQIVTV